MTTVDSRFLFDEDGLDSCLILDFMLGLFTNSDAPVAGAGVKSAPLTGVDAAIGVGLVVTCIVGVRGSGGGGGASGMTPAGMGLH